MLDKMIVKKYGLNDCNLHRKEIKAEQALTATRIYKLLGTQRDNPEWAAYDKYADEIVGIDTRIEEQEAVQGELQSDLDLIEQRIDVILQVVAVQQEYSSPAPAYQLGFFDSEKKRERMGVPC